MHITSITPGDTPAQPTICRCSRMVDGTCPNMWGRLHEAYGTCRCTCHSTPAQAPAKHLATSERAQRPAREPRYCGHLFSQMDDGSIRVSLVPLATLEYCHRRLVRLSTGHWDTSVQPGCWIKAHTMSDPCPPAWAPNKEQAR